MGQSKYQYDLDLRTFYDVMAVLDSQVYKSELVKHNLQTSIEEGVCLYIEGKTVDPLKDNVKAITDDIDRYIESLNFLKAKLNEYHDNMAHTFSIKDVNRSIYLDVLGLDEWLKALKNYFGIDSDEVNAVVNDSGVFQEFIYNTQKEITAKEQLYSDGFISDMIQGDRAIELEFRKEAQRYRDAKKKYEESSNIVRKKIKFEDELDEIIENISKAKGINDIEDAFSIESIREVLAQIREGNYNGIKDIKVDSYSVISPDDIMEGIKPSNVSTKGGEFLFYLESNPAYLESMYGISPDKQRPYHVILDGSEESIWTIGPGITSATEQGCYDRVNNALGYVGDKRKSPPDTFTMDELNNAAAVIMSEEYAININDQINDYNSYHNPEVQQLTQYQFDCLAQFYWQCGAGSTEYYSSFYDEVAKAQRDIDNGDLESAYNEMENAFSNYGVVPESRCKEAAELFVYGDYNI